MMLRCKTRYCATLTHFLVSLLVFAVLLTIQLAIWYPSPFFSASGGWQGLKIVALVDLVLGPLLTLIIYNTQKPFTELARDISIIVFIQLTALFWGIYTIHQQRPVVVTFWEDRFFTVPANAITSQNIDLATLEKFGDKPPYYTYIKRPVTPDEWAPILKKITEDDIGPHHQPELYQPLEGHFKEIYEREVDIKEIILANTDMRNEITAVLDKTNTELKDNHYVPLESRYRNIVLIFDRNNQLIGHASAPYKPAGRQ